MEKRGINISPIWKKEIAKCIEETDISEFTLFEVSDSNSEFSYIDNAIYHCIDIKFSKVKNKNQFKINSVIKKFVERNKLYVRSVTSDNGFEFDKIGILAKWLNCKAYYCNPYASYQRGSNENINELVRRLYKKGTNFNEISDQEIYELQEKINNMPRKLLGWKSSNEKFNEIAN